MTKLARHLGAWLAWWLALFWLWMLLVGGWNRIEWVAAAIAATLAATFAERVRTIVGARFGLSARAVAAAWNVPLMVFVDYGILIAALARSLARRRVVHGRFVVRDLGAAERRSAPRRAWTTYAALVSPNAYVVDADPERGLVLLHDLVPYRHSEEPA